MTPNLIAVLVGGGITFISTSLLSWFNYKRQDAKEKRSMATLLEDELTDVKDTVDKMEETFTQSTTKIVPKYYITELSKLTTSYDAIRARLFLFGDKNLRRDINLFYRKLQFQVAEQAPKAGSLKEGEEVKQKDILDKFIIVRASCIELKAKIEPYTKRNWWQF